MHKLLIASRSGDLKTVQEQINAGADIEMQEEDSGTPLFCATAEGHYEVVAFLLSKGAILGAGNCYGWTPIQVASQKNFLPILKLLIANAEKKDVFAQNHNKHCARSWYYDEDENTNNGDTAYHIAARHGHLQALELLVSAYPDGIHIQGKDRKTVLYYATKYGYSHITQYLLCMAVRFNKEDFTNDRPSRKQYYYCWPPLHIAAKRNHVAVLDVLLEYATVNELIDRNTYHDTPFHCAAWGGNLAALKCLLNKFPDGYKLTGAFGNPVWYTALAQQHYDLFEYLLNQYGSKILYQLHVSHGELPISRMVSNYVYCQQKEYQLKARCLILSMLDMDKNLALFIGVKVGRYIREKLINSQDPFDQYLIDIVDHNSQLRAFQLNHGPLYVAIEACSDIKLVNLLIENGAKVNEQDWKYQETPLHYATNNFNTFQHLLLAHNANGNLPDKAGQTAIDLMKEKYQQYNTLALLYKNSFFAAQLVCKLLAKFRLLNLIPLIERLPAELINYIVILDEQDSYLIEPCQITNIKDYSQDKKNLQKIDEKYKTKTEFLTTIGTNSRYGFFYNNIFIAPKSNLPLKLEANSSISPSLNIIK